ncbi:MAG: hypothetical protein WC441_02755 [Patescibacteria group bacterium]
MSIEYLPGLRPGDKIDLSQFEPKKNLEPRPEYYLGSLQASLRALSEKPGYKGFMDTEGKIIMSGSEADYDKKNIDIKERAWAQEKGLSWEEWTIKKESDPANLAEMGITLLFNRVLGDKFAVLRASDYDDYENGADNIIVDRESGAVICGIDDVLGRDGDDGSQKKAVKIKNKMDKGGARIKYGAAMEDGQLTSRSLEHVPLFYFSLSKAELNDLLHSLAENSKPSAKEKGVYKKLIESLGNQYAQFSADKSLHRDLQKNLASFAPSLEKMRWSAD